MGSPVILGVVFILGFGDCSLFLRDGVCILGSGLESVFIMGFGMGTVVVMGFGLGSLITF